MCHQVQLMVSSCPPVSIQEQTGRYCIIHNLACHCVPLHYSSSALNLSGTMASSPDCQFHRCRACREWCRHSSHPEKMCRISFVKLQKMLLSADTEGGGAPRSMWRSCHKAQSMCLNRKCTHTSTFAVVSVCV